MKKKKCGLRNGVQTNLEKVFWKEGIFAGDAMY